MRSKSLDLDWNKSEVVNRALLACPYRDHREPGDDPVPKIRIIRTRLVSQMRVYSSRNSDARLSLYSFFLRFGITFTTRAQAKIAYLYFERKVSCNRYALEVKSLSLPLSLREISFRKSVSLFGTMENEKTINRWKNE